MKPEYKERKPTITELDFFRRQSQIPAYAADDGNVVVNPYKIGNVDYDSVRFNEYIRQLLRAGYLPSPDFDLTPLQKNRFADYGNPQDVRDTIAARLLTGDPSAGWLTNPQINWGNEARGLLQK